MKNRFFFLIIITILLSGCNNASKDNLKDLSIDKSKYFYFSESMPRFTSSSNLDQVLNNLKPGNNFIFPDIYSKTDSIAISNTFILAEKLDKLGFKKVDSKSGEFKDGPKFFNWKYSNGELMCMVVKVTAHDGLESYEQLKCVKDYR